MYNNNEDREENNKDENIKKLSEENSIMVGKAAAKAVMFGIKATLAIKKASKDS